MSLSDTFCDHLGVHGQATPDVLSTRTLHLSETVPVLHEPLVLLGFERYHPNPLIHFLSTAKENRLDPSKSICAGESPVRE